MNRYSSSSPDPRAIAPQWFSRPSPQVAPDLVGCLLVRRCADGQLLRGMIVETEAYAPGDPACHAYRRRTKRNAVMFGAAGFTYVYLIYGMYHCLNVVTDAEDCPSAVLIRALDLETLPDWIDPKQRRKPSRVAAGPGKLCRAMQIDLSHTAKPLQPLQDLWMEPRSPDFQTKVETGAIALVQTTRIGISQGTELPWRWYLKDSEAVSKP